MSSIGQLIKQFCLQTIQSMKLTSLMEGEVVSAPPELKVKLKGNDKLIIPKELLVVAEHLTKEYKRELKVETKGKADLQGGMPSVTLTPIPSPISHTHAATALSVSAGDFSLKQGEAKMEYASELKAGDKVMVISFEGGQKFFIMDRIVSYAKGE
ncbi:DUF2577 domain-containing protein [Brevibacillus fluminis]|uniref:DUF2577 domain-containing protein n=1 Tax=Brevibacillus fluminis TaxID=511487 RepID=UPI0016065C81|nr:DUF2577 domain-containing protein [Brevibacillus fluminis]